MAPASAPIPTAELRGDADEMLTKTCREWALSLNLPLLAESVTVRWNARMRSTAGRAWWPQRCIELNPVIREIAPDQIQRTLLHELAHLVAYERAGRKRIAPHGAEWRMACADLGIAGESVCHHLPLPTRRLDYRFMYVCMHCQRDFPRKRKITRAYACSACCRRYAHGRFDRRFLLVEKSL
jgi:predicted SprT family Zn-dependent metalloprotease